MPPPRASVDWASFPSTTRRGRHDMDRGAFSLGRGPAFWLLALMLALLLFAASAPSPLYREYQSTMGFSPLTLTAIYASYAAGGVATLLMTGRLSDHLGRRPVLT